MKLKALGLAGLLLLSTCKSLPKEQPFEKQYGTRLMMGIGGKMMSFEYDTDNDGTGDLKLSYEFVNVDNDIAYLKLRIIADDKNRNGIFETNEVRQVDLKEDELEEIKPEGIIKNYINLKKNLDKKIFPNKIKINISKLNQRILSNQ